MDIVSKTERTKIKGVMDNSIDRKNESETVCSICKALGKTSISISYCVECQEKLCDMCKNIHRVSKLSKHHTVFDIDNILDGGIHSNDNFKCLSKYTLCTEHEAKLEFYCKVDDLFLCLMCYPTHVKQCKNIQEIEPLSCRQENSREALKILKDDILKLSRYATQITDTLKVVRDNQRKESADINTRLTNIRTTVINVIDRLEDSVLSRHRALLKQDQFRRTELEDKLCEIGKDLKRKVSLIEKLLKVGSEFQFVVASHRIMSELNEDEKLILEGCDTYKTSIFKITESNTIRELLSVDVNDIEHLANVESKECRPEFPKYKSMSWFNAEFVEIQSVLGSKDYQYGPLFTSILFLPNNNILLIDSRHGVCNAIDENSVITGTKKFMPVENEEVDFEQMPSSATVLQSGEIAISVPEEKRIYLVDSVNFTNLAHVNTKYKPKFIHGLTNGDIAVAWDEPVAFGIISSKMTISQWRLPERLRVLEKVHFTQDKSGRNLNHFESMAIDNWRSCVVQSSTEDSAVYCFDFEGTPKFCYQNHDLAQPNGLAIDENGYIFICEGKTSCIHVLNYDGVLMQIIQERCPASPLAIGIDTDSRRFAVSNSGFGFAGRDITYFRILTMSQAEFDTDM